MRDVAEDVCKSCWGGEWESLNDFQKIGARAAVIEHLSGLHAAGYRIVTAEPTPEAVASWWRCKNSGGSDYEAYRHLVAAFEMYHSVDVL